MAFSSNGIDVANSSNAATTISSHPRHAYTRSILGQELFNKLCNAKILVVGAGGIGCELLKNLSLVGIGDIEVIDLDTIDLSNLNRQFLFTKAHINKSKSMIASTTAQQFNPLVHITPYHANVKDTAQFGWEYFEKFDVVCNALDNLDARRWVNRMCIMTGVPLVESGTTGFLGQVQPIMKGITECYDCTAKPIPRTYPVCTIRSTPSTPIHCIVWAKTWLLVQLFGSEDENEDAELDKALQDGENAEQIANLRKEAAEMGAIRSAIASIPDDASIQDQESICRRTFDKIFQQDVERLLRMEDMWRNRRQPIPIQYDEAHSEQQDAIASTSNGHSNNGSNSNRSSNSNSSSSSTYLLRDQMLLSLKETVELFKESLLALAHRMRQYPGESITFDKDDLDTLNFVTATSNLRSRIYHIAPQTRFQVKEMAGNIIPAIASTNAIIAGAQVFQLLHALRHAWKDSRFVSLNKMNSARLITSSICGKPNLACGVCQDDYARATVNLEKVTLGQFKEAVLQSRDNGGLGYQVEGLEIFESLRLLADEDFNDNLQQSLKALGVENGMIITCADEDGIRANLHIMVTAPAGESSTNVHFGPVDKLPILNNKTKVEKKAAESDDDEDGVVELTERPVPAASTSVKRKRSVPEHGGEHNNGDAVEAEARKKRNRPALPQSGAHEKEAIELD